MLARLSIRAFPKRPVSEAIRGKMLASSGHRHLHDTLKHPQASLLRVPSVMLALLALLAAWVGRLSLLLERIPKHEKLMRMLSKT